MANALLSVRLAQATIPQVLSVTHVPWESVPRLGVASFVPLARFRMSQECRFAILARTEATVNLTNSKELSSTVPLVPMVRSLWSRLISLAHLRVGCAPQACTRAVRPKIVQSALRENTVASLRTFAMIAKLEDIQMIQNPVQSALLDVTVWQGKISA